MVKTTTVKTIALIPLQTLRIGYISMKKRETVRIHKTPLFNTLQDKIYFET